MVVMMPPSSSSLSSSSTFIKWIWRIYSSYIIFVFIHHPAGWISALALLLAFLDAHQHHQAAAGNITLEASSSCDDGWLYILYAGKAFCCPATHHPHDMSDRPTTHRHTSIIYPLSSCCNRGVSRHLPTQKSRAEGFVDNKGRMRITADEEQARRREDEAEEK